MEIDELIEREDKKTVYNHSLMRILQKSWKEAYDERNKSKNVKKYNTVVGMMRRGICELNRDNQAHKRIISILNYLKERYQGPIEGLKSFFGRSDDSVFVALAWEGASGDYFESEAPILKGDNSGNLLNYGTKEEAYKKLDQRIKEVGNNFNKEFH